MMAKEARRCVGVHLPVALYEWVERESRRRKVSRSRLVYGAIECYRLLESAGSLSRVVRRIARELPSDKPRRETKMQKWLREQKAHPK